MNKRSILLTSVLAVALALGLILIGCGGGSSPTAPYGSGGTGTASFDSGTLTAPAGFDHVFPSAGTFGYHCKFHVSMGMVGTVVVQAGGASSASVSASGTSFSPSSVTIAPGGTVHWTISGGTHTVTSD